MTTTIKKDEARLNITHNGQNGELPDPILWDRDDAQVINIATEAVRGGSVPGITPDVTVNFSNYKVQRFPAEDDLPNRIHIRPAVPFGVGGEDIGGEDP